MKKIPAFWDSSALVPLCVNEMASSAATSHMRSYGLVVWWGSRIEVHSTICRINREKTITDEGKKASVARLEVLSRTWREISPGEKLRDVAVELLNSYPLKAGDSLQLAASLIWCDERPARRNFVCSDQRLSKAARSIGFAVVEISG